MGVSLLKNSGQLAWQKLYIYRELDLLLKNTFGEFDFEKIWHPVVSYLQS